MRPSSWPLLFLLLVPLLLHAARAASGGAAAAVGVEDNEHGGGQGHHAAPVTEGDAFYLQVGRFAVMVHSMWHGIKPVPRLERVVSASKRPAAGGGGVDYLLVLRAAPPLGTCRALVWGVPGEGSQEWKLKYFEPVARA